MPNKTENSLNDTTNINHDAEEAVSVRTPKRKSNKNKADEIEMPPIT